MKPYAYIRSHTFHLPELVRSECVVNKMLFYHKDDLIPVCICCCILFPVFIDHHGHTYLLLCIIASFLCSKVFFITKKGKCLE